jgi:hypothetical protein
MYHRHMVVYHCISASELSFELSLRELTRSINIYPRPLWEHTHTPWKLQSWFATTTSWVHTQKIIGTSKWEGYWSSFTQTNQSNCLEPPSCTTDTWYKYQTATMWFCWRKIATNHWTWTSRGVKYATHYGYFTRSRQPHPDAFRLPHHSVVEIREDSRPHKRARTDASVIHGKK